MHIDPVDASFGRIKASDATHNRTLTITPGDAGPIAPILLPFDAPGIYAQLCEIEPGERYDLEVSVSPPWKPGRLRHALRLETGVDEMPVMDVWVKGHVTPE